ncbi:unnamed protein product, partial [Lampetra planeri]
RLQKDLRQLNAPGVKKSSRGRTCARCQRGLACWLYKVETGEWFLEEKAKRFGGKVEPATDIIRVSMKRAA